MITNVTIKEYLSTEKETYGYIESDHKGVFLKLYKFLSLAEWEVVMDRIRAIDIKYELAEEAVNQ